MTFPSPNVILPLISRTVTSPTCLIAVCILTGVGPCMPSPSRSRIPHAEVASSCDSVRTTISERPSLRTSRKKAASSEHFSSGVGLGASASCETAEPTVEPAPAPAHPAAAAALPPALRDHVKQILQLQFPHALL